jgi:hypothetical protein
MADGKMSAVETGSKRLISVRSVVQLYPGPWVRNTCPAFAFAIVGRFSSRRRRIRSVLPSDRSPHQAEPLQPIAESLEVLLHPVFHHLGAVSNRSEVRVDLPDHRLGFVAEFARNGVGRDRRALVQVS